MIFREAKSEEKIISNFFGNKIFRISYFCQAISFFFNYTVFLYIWFYRTVCINKVNRIDAIDCDMPWPFALNGDETTDVGLPTSCEVTDNQTDSLPMYAWCLSIYIHTTNIYIYKTRLPYKCIYVWIHILLYMACMSEKDRDTINYENSYIHTHTHTTMMSVFIYIYNSVSIYSEFETCATAFVLLLLRLIQIWIYIWLIYVYIRC